MLPADQGPESCKRQCMKLGMSQICCSYINNVHESLYSERPSDADLLVEGLLYDSHDTAANTSTELDDAICKSKSTTKILYLGHGTRSVYVQVRIKVLS
jgi:hypothetical protein